MFVSFKLFLFLSVQRLLCRKYIKGGGRKGDEEGERERERFGICLQLEAIERAEKGFVLERKTLPNEAIFYWRESVELCSNVDNFIIFFQKFLQ